MKNTLKAFLGANKNNLNPIAGGLYYFNSWKEKRPSFIRDNHGQKVIQSACYWSCLSPVRTRRDLQRAHVYFVSDYLSGGDYSNSCAVELSNFQVFMAQFKDCYGKDWIEVNGSYGSYAIAIRLSSRNEDIQECLRGLENYPVINEDHLSQLEDDLYSDYLQSEAYSIENDVTAALYATHELSEDDTEKELPDWDSIVDRDECLELFWQINSDMPSSYEIESGCNVHIPYYDRVIERVVDDYKWRYDRPEFPHSDWNPNQTVLQLTFK